MFALRRKMTCVAGVHVFPFEVHRRMLYVYVVRDVRNNNDDNTNNNNNHLFCALIENCFRCLFFFFN